MVLRLKQGIICLVIVDDVIFHYSLSLLHVAAEIVFVIHCHVADNLQGHIA